MSSPVVSSYRLSDVAAVTVTYNADLTTLRRQLLALPAAVRQVVVDNGSQNKAAIEELLTVRRHAEFLALEQNVGLAAALNRGVARAAKLTPSPAYVLLLDQDSEPCNGSVEALVEALNELVSRGERVGAIGPRLVDSTSGATHGFHHIRGWRWTRSFPDANAPPVAVAGLNGSGTLCDLARMLELGGVDETFFIDHVDTEWSFRLLAAGYTLWGVPRSAFLHEMGAGSTRYWLCGWRVWPDRTPARHTFLFRNALWLMRREYVPTVWKMWALAKLALTACVVGVRGPARVQQLVAMLRGVRDGIFGAPSSMNRESESGH